MKRLEIQLVCLTGSKFPVLPYVCALLEESAREAFVDFDSQFFFHPYIFNTVQGGVDFEFGKISKIDVAGLSCYPWNWIRSVKLARMIKDRYPDCFLIAGGPLIPESQNEADDFLKNNDLPFDIYVYGEGERQWIELLKNLYVSRSRRQFYENLKKVPNIYFYDEFSRFHFTHKELSQRYSLGVNSAYINNLNMSKAIDECDQLGLPRIAVWETNRGCPYSCTFCNWGSATRQKIRVRNEDIIFLEAEWMLNNIDIVNMADANFGIIPRDYEIAKYLAEHSRNSRLKQVVFSAAKNNTDRVAKISGLLYRSGLLKNGALVGLQSLDSNVLNEIERTNIPTGILFESIKKFKDEKVPYFFDLILGLPYETKKTFCNAINKLLLYEPADIRVHALALFPNSKLYTDKDRYGFKTSEWRIYDDPRHEDEDEYFSVVTETSSLNADQMKSMKSISEMIEYLHLGKILYYIANFMYRHVNLSFTDFYEGLISVYSGTDTPVGLLTNNGYFKKYNSGSTTSLVGPHYPFNIPNNTPGFRKCSYIWLVLMENKEEFYTQIQEFLNHRYPELNDLTEDLVLFQKNKLIAFDYDPNFPKSYDYRYDWVAYFSDTSLSTPPLKFNRVTYHDLEIDGKKIYRANPNSYLNVVGQFIQNYDRSVLYEHQVFTQVFEN
jgi:putative methyltransferase